MYITLCSNKNNVSIVDDRPIRTRAHDAILYKTVRPNNEKYKRNVFFYGARMWNDLPVKERKTETYEAFKSVRKIKPLFQLCNYITLTSPFYNTKVKL